MATKTISIDLEAYDRLRHARLRREESFSQVIKRATWGKPGHTAGEFLAAMASCPVVDAKTLDRLDAAQRQDAPPENAWQKP
jgi:predicted CopG family antitoxin